MKSFHSAHDRHTQVRHIARRPRPARLIALAISWAIVLTFVAASALSQVVLAQSPITAQAEPTRLTIDEQLTLNVTVSGDFLTVPSPDLAQLQDFVVVSSSVSTQVSIINGKMSSQKIFLYRLQPLSEGNLQIGPISVNIGGQLYETEPIEIEVLSSRAQITPSGEPEPEAESPDTLNGQEYFVEAEVDNPSPYLGEQIIYTFRLYQATKFLGQPDYKPPTFTDFWSSEIVSQPRYNIQSQGRQYFVSEIRTALFPANLGSITIDPATLTVPGGLFNPDVKLETNPVSVEVRPLPTGAPDGFSGAVGQFDIASSLSESETKVNEPVTLVVEIEGTGNIQTLTEPTLPDLPRWRVFESQAKTRTETDADKIRGVRIFERLVVPGNAGNQTFPPIDFSYYDPQAEAYQTVSTDPIPISVLPDDSAPVPPLPVDIGNGGGLNVDRISTDIRHIKPVPTALSLGDGFSGTGWYVLGCIWVAPVLAVGGVHLWQKRQKRLQRDTAFARDQRARRSALRTLADGQPSGVNEADVAGRALLGYLSDKLNTPTVGLTSDNLLSLLEESELEPELIQRVGTILQQVDVGRFAPVSAEAGQSIIDNTKQLIDDLEKSFGKRR